MLMMVDLGIMRYTWFIINASFCLNPIMTNFNPAILLTGARRVGKTTAIQNIVSHLGANAGGFYSPEVRENSHRIAFEIVTLDGKKALISTKKTDVIFTKEIQVGNHRVNLDVIDSIIVPTLVSALEKKDIVVIDEIGPMEITSTEFCHVILRILDSNVIVVGTIVEDSIPFTNQVKAHPRARLRKVTLENRDKIPQEILSKLQNHIHSEQLPNIHFKS